MAKVIRLKSHEQHEWYRNQTMLVKDTGEVVRPVSSKEQMTMFQMTKHVAQTGQPFATKTPDEASTIEARLDKLPGSNKALVKFFIDGFEVRGGREVMKARILAEHGTCQLRALNGKFIAMVHDTRTMRTVPTGATTAGTGVPAPDQCLCVRWPLSNGSPHPGKHHPVCQYNDKAPLDQRGSFSDVGGAAVPQTALSAASVPLAQVIPMNPAVATAVPVPVAASVPVAPVEPPTPSPQECHCKGWALPSGEKKPDDVHHPVCEFKEKWESTHAEKYLLVDLEDMTVRREATADEITDAEKNEATGGVMVTTIGDKVYGVMLESEVKEASANATVQVAPTPTPAA